MADVTFIDKDPEQILVDTIDLYQAKAGSTLNDADPERILIDCMTYREVLLRNGMEWMMRQNFVQLAEGGSLDYWGGLFTVPRNDSESDGSYRARILAANKTNGLGTKAAYKARILSLPDVADVLLFSKNDDPSLLPGRVRITPIKKTTVDSVSCGAVHDAALETTIVGAITTDDFGVIGNMFLFAEAVPVAVDGTVNARAVSGFGQSQLEANINYQLNRYFGALSLSFSSEFGASLLTTYLGNAEGLSQITGLNFPNVPVLATGEFYRRGTVTINIEQ
jgi:hypothetical protein